MSNLTPQRSMENGLLQRHPPSVDFLSPPPPPDLTDNIVKIDDRYVAGGAFGDVYRCRYVHGSTSQEVAVKALRFKLPVDGDMTMDKSIKMVRRELGFWKRLNHNNIVPFLGVASGFGMDGAISLVSLWMPNDTLHKFLVTHDNKLDVVHRLQILLDVAKGLDYLHTLPFPIVHGDLNSNNVLLDADYNARLADFGYASCVGDIPEALGYLRRSTDRPGALRWIAPEQISLEGPIIRTTKNDIYSFGSIAFEVLFGKQPWYEVAEDAAVVLRLYLGHKPGRPESRVIDDSHWNVIQCCWSPSQERPSADSIIVSIQGLLSNYPPSEPLRDLFVLPSSQAQEPLSGSSPSLTVVRAPSLPADPTYPLAHPIDSAVLTTNSLSMSPPSQPTYLQVWLLRPLADFWNKVKRDLLSRPTMDISENDMVVFVVGPTGSGKSWFTNTATKCDLVKVSTDQHPSTGKVQAVRCELTGEAKRDPQEVKNIVFVDTPSFLTGYDKPDPHKEFRAWFKQIVYKPRHVGMIYMHRVETDPTLKSKSIKDHLQEFSNVFWSGEVSAPLRPQRLLVVVSYDKTSGTISGSKIMQRISDLSDQASLLRGKWQPSTIHEELFQGEPEVAWRAVGELVRNL